MLDTLYARRLNSAVMPNYKIGVTNRNEVVINAINLRYSVGRLNVKNSV